MSLTGAKILIVDDEPALVDNLREILSDEGAEVAHASTAEEATARSHEAFDCALVDIHLPDATGLAVLSTLKAARGPLIEVLLITGSASLDYAIAAVKWGAYAYVLKPFDPHELISSVRRAVQQVRTQREADDLATALKESETKLRTLVDTVQALLLVVDENGRVLQVNRAVAEAVGKRPFELIGTRWLDEFVAEDRDSMQTILSRILNGEQKLSHEARLRSANPLDAGHNVRWIRWLASSLRTSHEGLRIYVSGLDVTDAREYERRARVSEKLAAVGTLSAGLAHEIRNPLNAATLQLQLLRRKLQKLEVRDVPLQIIDTVEHEIGRLSQLVHDFLRFARPSELTLKPVDLCALVRHVLALERELAAQTRITLAIELPQNPVIVEADQAKLEQVLFNLLRNAIEALEPRASGNIVMSVARHERGHAVLTISDDGPGIPPEHVTRIFEPFFSTKESGTGLGMAICHSLIALHGGEIRVTSTPEGTRFVVELPQHPPKPSYVSR